MEKIRIGSYQGPIVDNDFEANLKNTRKVLEKAKDMNLDFLCFPETYLTGYSEKAVLEGAITLDDERLQTFIRDTRGIDTLIIIGLSERAEDGIYNTCLVIYKGNLVGKARKTMLTRGYDDKLFEWDMDNPVFEHKGIKFGMAICHTTSFVEPAQILRLKGARLLFTPHFNNIAPEIKDENNNLLWSYSDHRTMVLNNQAALATLLKMVVVRSNVIVVEKNALGSGDSNMWDMDGRLVASGTPFVEEIVVGEFDKNIFEKEHIIDRREMPLKMYEKIYEAAKEYWRDKDEI